MRVSSNSLGCALEYRLLDIWSSVALSLQGKAELNLSELSESVRQGDNIRGGCFKSARAMESLKIFHTA